MITVWEQLGFHIVTLVGTCIGHFGFTPTRPGPITSSFVPAGRALPRLSCVLMAAIIIPLITVARHVLVPIVAMPLTAKLAPMPIVVVTLAAITVGATVFSVPLGPIILPRLLGVAGTASRATAVTTMALTTIRHRQCRRLRWGWGRRETPVPLAPLVDVA